VKTGCGRRAKSAMAVAASGEYGSEVVEYRAQQPVTYFASAAAGSEHGHGSPHRHGPQAGGDCDVDEAAIAGRQRRSGQSFVATTAGMKWV
jgi:hypothetical protein